jgi:hypothetical protein
VVIFATRPRWDKPEGNVALAVAKATCVKTAALWKVYGQRADLKWHRCDPAPQGASLEKFLTLAGEGAYGCFFG